MTDTAKIEIPQVTHEAEVELLGVKVRVYRLDDGRTIIPADDMEKIMKLLIDGGAQ